MESMLDYASRPTIFGEIKRKIYTKTFSSKWANLKLFLNERKSLAIVIRDQFARKNESIYEEKDFCEIIKEGKTAQITKDFMIIARIEEMLYGKTVDEALKRAISCATAGADAILIESRIKRLGILKNFAKNLGRNILILLLQLFQVTLRIRLRKKCQNGE